MAKKPAQLPRRAPLTKAQIEAAKYVGSPEHKVQRYWGGLPEAWEDAGGVARRQGKLLTTICRLITEAERDQATGWVGEALRSQQFLYREADKDFPWLIWYRERNGILWMGQCVNSVAGHYKGWPITEEQRCEVFDGVA